MMDRHAYDVKLSDNSNLLSLWLTEFGNLSAMQNISNRIRNLLT